MATTQTTGSAPALAQQIDFALGYEQIIKMLFNAESNGIRITLGITITGEIVVESSGIKIDNSGVITITSESERPCPIPPGCPTNEECRQKALATMPPEVNTGSLNLLSIFETFINR